MGDIKINTTLAPAPLPPSGGSQKKVVYVLLGLVVVFAAWMFIAPSLNKPKTEEKPTNEAPVITTAGDLQESVDPGKLPGDLPADLPVEIEAATARNEMLYFKNSQELLSVRSYYSEKSVKENRAVFEKYFTDNKWQILTRLDEENLVYILAQKTGLPGTLSVNISLSGSPQRVLVELTHTQKDSVNIKN